MSILLFWSWPKVDFETKVWVETLLWLWSQGRLKAIRTVSITTLWCTLSRPAIVRLRGCCVGDSEMFRVLGVNFTMNSSHWWCFFSYSQLGGQRHLHLIDLILILFVGFCRSFTAVAWSFRFISSCAIAAETSGEVGHPLHQGSGRMRVETHGGCRRLKTRVWDHRMGVCKD